MSDILKSLVMLTIFLLASCTILAQDVCRIHQGSGTLCCQHNSKMLILSSFWCASYLQQFAGSNCNSSSLLWKRDGIVVRIYCWRKKSCNLYTFLGDLISQVSRVEKAKSQGEVAVLV
jgi:hypothetical protein